MTVLFPSTLVLSLTLTLGLYGCSIQTKNHAPSNDRQSDTAMTATPPSGNTDQAVLHKSELTTRYTQAIGDYIRLVREEYQLTFDTLFFGKHVHGHATDFPDIDFPTSIENTTINVISPEQGEKIQGENESSFYINLVGSVNRDDATFIFVTFSNGFAHQFDCFTEYTYDRALKKSVLVNSRFEPYQYRKK